MRGGPRLETKKKEILVFQEAEGGRETCMEQGNQEGLCASSIHPQTLPSIPQTDSPLACGEQDTTIQWKRRQETGLTQLSYEQLLLEEKCGNPRVL